jgi:hypothetical protein
MEKPVTNDPNAAPQQASAQKVPQPAPKTESPKAMAAPTSSAVKPNKNADVPKYGSCMASDPRINEEEIDAILARGAKK